MDLEDSHSRFVSLLRKYHEANTDANHHSELSLRFTQEARSFRFCGLGPETRTTNLTTVAPVHSIFGYFGRLGNLHAAVFRPAAVRS